MWSLSPENVISNPLLYSPLSQISFKGLVGQALLKPLNFGFGSVDRGPYLIFKDLMTADLSLIFHSNLISLKGQVRLSPFFPHFHLGAASLKYIYI